MSPAMKFKCPERQEEILRRMHDGGKLYLIVDHGYLWDGVEANDVHGATIRGLEKRGLIKAIPDVERKDFRGRTWYGIAFELADDPIR